MSAGSLDYAQARMQARHGDRVGAAAWHRVESVRDLAALLDAARATSLRPLLVGITAASSSDEIEAALRRHWRERVDEVASWMPPRWQAAVAWCAWLPDLAPLQHLARTADGAAPAAWLLADPQWRELAAAAPAGRDPEREFLGGAGDAPAASRRLQAADRRPLAAAWRRPDAIGSAWHAEWRRRWPTMDGDALSSMQTFERTIAAHITRYPCGLATADPASRTARQPSAVASAVASATASVTASVTASATASPAASRSTSATASAGVPATAPTASAATAPGSSTDDSGRLSSAIASRAAAAGRGGSAQRRALAARLVLLWRRVALQPAAAFVHLALAALDIERLRAELLARRLFPQSQPAA